MAEEFLATGICNGNWWNLPKNDHMGSYGSWLVSDISDLKPRSCKLQQDSININSSLVFQDLQKSCTDSDHSGGLMDSSSMQMTGFGISSSNSSSSPSSDWTQTLLRGNSMLQEEMNSQIQKDWSPKSFTDTQEDSSINTYKAINHQDFSLEQQQQRLSPLTNSGNSYVYQSTPLIQSLFEPSDHDHQPSFYNDRTAINYSNSPQNYGTILNELSPSWPKLASFLKPSMPRQQSQHTGQHTGGLHFSNNTPFWNASTDFLSPTSQPQFIIPTFEGKPNSPNLVPKLNNEGQVRDSGSVTKNGSEPALKRARIETPSPLPTFKVRKEKLGDRITALQQLVSPFGKTDTASVLHEAIEYIKFLHDQVNVLSTPYMKNGNPIQHQQVGERVKEAEGSKQDLKSRGLCLVPISSTFPVAHETTADFWTPSFGV